MSYMGDAFRTIRDEIKPRKFYKKSKTKKLKDLSEIFVTFLKKGATNPEFSFLALIYGTGGGGKTSLCFIIASIMMKSDDSRNLALWQTPPALEEAVKKQLVIFMGKEKGKEWSNRVRTIHFVRDIRQHDIVLVDEGVINLNAKDALTKEAKSFEQFITGARHMRVVVLVNSITVGVQKAFRDASQIKIYKLMPEEILEQFKSKFVKENMKKIMKLEPQESLIQASHKKLMDKGIIILDLSDYCPWYNDEISRSMSTVGTADFSSDKDMEVESRINEVAEKAIEYFKDKELKEWLNPSVIRGWMRKEEYDDWRTLSTRSGAIVDTIRFKMITEHSEESLDDDSYEEIEELQKEFGEEETISNNKPFKKNKKNDDFDDISDEIQDMSTDIIFKNEIKSVDKVNISKDVVLESPKPDEVRILEMPEFFYKCALNQGYDKRKAKIAEFTMKGYSLQQMSTLKDIDYKETMITMIRKELNQKYFGYWNEWYLAHVLGEEPNTALNDDSPDLVTKKPSSYMGIQFEAGTIFSIKFRIVTRFSETFYQHYGEDNDQAKNCNPEYLEAKKLGKKYWFAYYNPVWNPEHYYLREIDPNGSNIIDIKKPKDDKVLF